MKIATVQEQRGQNLIKILLIMLDKFDIKKPLIHLSRPLEEGVKSRGIVQDVYGNEDEDVNQEQEGRHR